MQTRASREIVRPTRAYEELAGFLYANAAGGWILVKQGDYLPRRRFTVAHELGHYILHFLPLLEHHSASRRDDPFDLSESLPPNGESPASDETGTGSLVIHSTQGRESGIRVSHESKEQLEQQADLFAAELLMPEDLCRALRDQFAPRYGTRIAVLARRLASEMLVSEAAMTRRLAELQVV
jgi:Zn-dependent peptidase ImmA (M78 family)